jgi:chemotaxis protein CheC
MPYSQLTQGQFDVLLEISSIGMGHAATAMSQLLDETIQLNVPRVTLTEIAEVPELLGGAENLVAGVTLQILGDARGNILLVFPSESASRLLGRLLRQEEAVPLESEIAVSTLKEVGNILASAYLNALGGLLGKTLIPSIPMFSCDMAGAVVDYLLIELSELGDQALTVETEFRGDDSSREPIRGHFFLLPDPQSLHVLLTSVGGENGAA